jgi:alpha-2-macroglobulin
MHRRASFALATLVTLVVVGSGCRRGEPPPLGLEATTTGPLVFPPPDEGWTDRAPLPPGASSATLRDDHVVSLSWPTLDEKKRFKASGQIVRFGFSESLVDPASLGRAPALKISPPVAGQTVWTYGSEVEFRAAKPFDPETDYTVSLPEMTAPSGKKLEGGFEATFRATPEIEIAGKDIHYLPKPGHARVLRTLPDGAGKVGGAQEIRVLYDQPVDVALARKLVSLSGPDGELPQSLRHAHEGTFDGAKVDPRFVIVVRPQKPLAAGARLTLAARPEAEGDDEPTQRTFEVAEPTTLVEVGCGSSRDCEAEGSVVRAQSTSGVRIRFNNPLGLGWNEGQKHVQVTPRPKNLWISGWGEELSISGSFSPSTTYAIRVAGVRDAYGGAVSPAAVTFHARPLPASATIPSGATVLDEATTRAYPVATRNVVRGELLLWKLPVGDVPAFQRAVRDVRAGTSPAGEPRIIPFSPPPRQDTIVETFIDLGSNLDRGAAYVAEIRVTKTAQHATETDFPHGSPASRKPMALLVTAGAEALGAHVHRAGHRAVVQVFRLATGQPVEGAQVALGPSTATSDGRGTAVVAAPPEAPGSETVVAIRAGDTQLLLPVSGDGDASASTLFPELARRGDDDPAPGDVVGMLVTDRGVYRPGSTMFVKGVIRKLDGAAVRAIAGAKVRLRVTDPLGTDVVDEAMTTNPRGAVTREVIFAKNGHTGRFHVRLEIDDQARGILADETIRVADFEAPRFKVDVEPAGDAPPDRIKARVVGRYLFGAPMAGARVTWTLRKRAVPVRGGLLADKGLSFERETWYGDEESPDDALHPVTGEGLLSPEGTLEIDAVTGPLAKGPTEVLLEADVTDASNRHVAGSHRVVKDPFSRHAGLKLARRFGEAGAPLRVGLGVVDPKGNGLRGVRVEARLEKLTWTRTAERAESGALVERWKDVGTTVSRCGAVSDDVTPVSCDLAVDRGGSYRVVTSVDGREGAQTSYYAWGRWDGGSPAAPSEGKKVPLVTDRAKYAAGETATILVQSPYAASTALLTVEQGGVVHHETKTLDGPSGTFEIKVTGANAPWVHAVVTLLPISGRVADYRVGAVRIPVGSEDQRLDVTVTSAKPSYEAKSQAEITIQVKKGTAPVKDADVVLAVVDEGVLRMTSFHAKDPVNALRPGRSLDFRLTDSRAWLMSRRERAHVAGDGDSEGEDALDTRKNFVETAAWLPSLVTDAEGRAIAKIDLPDNLTEFRMMAVVLDDAGRGGSAESSFVVTKPVLLDPVMPRFARRGDRFEAAAIVHNNTDAAVPAKVTVAGQTRDVSLPPRGRARVAVPMTADRTGSQTMVFAVEALGKLRDRVEIPLRVEHAGTDHHPRLSGVFAGTQEIGLAIPDDALFDDDAELSIKTGSALYPELGQRLTYLLDYPHGCVEQTTSSTLPLIAARTILPWTGTSSLDDEEIRKRIQRGVERLGSMQTRSGGLAYWPGDTEPNVYGTAWAFRALVRAKALGIEQPRLVEQVGEFLRTTLGNEGREVRVAIAESLAMAGLLEESDADMLWDTREELDTFGLASLALALASLPNQDDRVKEALDRVEASFEADGTSKSKHDERDWHHWGSSERDRAQATIALGRLRKGSPLLQVLAQRLARDVEGYTTQATAWSLMALADYIGDRAPNGGVDVKLRLEGRILDTYEKLGGNNKEVRVPLRDLRGKRLTLILDGDAKTPTAFSMEARYKRPLGASASRIGRRAAKGVSIHRAFSEPNGTRLDLAKVKAGQVVRVALRIEMPELDSYRLGYAAVTDRLPAGFEPIDPDLATTGHVPDLTPEHPFHEGFRGSGQPASHVDLRDDRVQIYFDRIWGGRVVHATYLARATTPGSFALGPAQGELMYEPESDGFSDAGSVTIVP